MFSENELVQKYGQPTARGTMAAEGLAKHRSAKLQWMRWDFPNERKSVFAISIEPETGKTWQIIDQSAVGGE